MQQNTGYSMMCYQMSKQLQQICVHWVERTVVAHVKLTRRTGPVWQRSNLLIALMKTLKRLFYVLKHPALPFPLCTCTVINITYNILESYKWPDEKTLKDCQKLALKKIVFHLSWSTKNITTFPNAKGTGASIKEDKPHLSPLSRTSHTPSAQHRKSHSSTPFPWFRHPGPTLKRPFTLCQCRTSALLLVFDQKDGVLPSTGGHQYFTVLQLFACHLHRTPLIIFLSSAKLQVGAHAPGIHRSWSRKKWQ